MLFCFSLILSQCTERKQNKIDVFFPQDVVYTFLLAWSTRHGRERNTDSPPHFREVAPVLKIFNEAKFILALFMQPVDLSPFYLLWFIRALKSSFAGRYHRWVRGCTDFLSRLWISWWLSVQLISFIVLRYSWKMLLFYFVAPLAIYGWTSTNKYSTIRTSLCTTRFFFKAFDWHFLLLLLSSLFLSFSFICQSWTENDSEYFSSLFLRHSE